MSESRTIAGAETIAGAIRRCTAFFQAALLLTAMLLPTLVTAAEQRIVRVGAADNPPIAFRGSDGKAQGIAVDVLNDVAQKENWRLEFVHGPWQDVLKQLERGEIDLLTGIAYTPARAKQFQFTNQTLLSNWGVVYAAPGSKIRSLLDLENRRVAFAAAATHSDALQQMLKEFGVHVVPVTGKDYQEVFALVASGAADAGVVSRVFSVMNAASYQLESTGIVFNPIEVRYAAPKNADPMVISTLDKHLEALLNRGDSAYFESLDRWLGAAKTRSLPVWVKWVLIGAAGTLALAVFFVLLLRRQVNARTAALRDVEESFRATFNHAAIGIARVGPDGSWLDANQRICDILGYAREELLKGSFQDITHPDDLANDLAHVSRLLSGESSAYSIEKRYIHKSGRTVWAELTVGLVHKEDGSPKYFVSVVEDITRRKQTEQALRESERLLAESQTIARVGSWTKDISTGKMAWSKETFRLYGLSPETDRAPLADEFVQLLHPDDRLSVREWMNACRSGAPNAALEFRTRPVDGVSRWLLGHGVLEKSTTGEPLRIIGTTQDITDRKEADAARGALEVLLRESQKMEAIGTLAGGIAHDFNNIIAAIVGNAELARQDVGPAHPAQESLGEIGKASRRAKELVQQILSFSRRQVMERRVISLAPVVEESTRLLRAALPAGLNFEVECAPNAPPVLGDATQIEQVLLNLCNNAWQSIQGQSRPGKIAVRVEAHERSVGQTQDAGFVFVMGDLPPGRYACITVSDNGSGMDTETLARMFEPFFTTKPVGKGTGLGLAVVHGIVKEHSAGLEVRSAPGEGSTFRIYFPAAQAAGLDVPASAAANAPARGLGQHVLYVDDDEALVFLVTRLLDRQGYRVSGYTDPREALAAVRTRPHEFDLAVTDYNMPGMSGLDLARALREIRQDLPVALASGYITEELRALAPAAGVREIIHKPNTVDELCETVARLAQAVVRPSPPS